MARVTARPSFTGMLRSTTATSGRRATLSPPPAAQIPGPVPAQIPPVTSTRPSGSNPGDTDATVEIQYLPQTPDAIPGSLTRTVMVPARARATIDVDNAMPALRDTPFGMIVTGSAPIIAERSIYWTHNGPAFIGGTNAMGAVW